MYGYLSCSDKRIFLNLLTGRNRKKSFLITFEGTLMGKNFRENKDLMVLSDEPCLQGICLNAI